VPTDEERQYWDGQAASFDEAADHGLRDPVVREAWRELLRSVLPDPPADVADLGCGTGSLAVLLAHDGYRLTGLDASAAMVGAARAKAAAAGVEIVFRQNDAAAPELSERAFDVVLARHVLWMLPDPADVLRRWTALLRSGGRLVLVEGRWATGAGLTVDEVLALVEPVAEQIEMRTLADAALWGRPIDDDRYLVVAHR
jgi:2-polyprenyl-3-methyl-5-hydroxy-6-metoxy-1,4-benzoquinol methylase